MTRHKSHFGKFYHKTLIKIIPISIVLALLYGCYIPGGQHSKNEIGLYQEGDLTSAPINIEFTLVLPQALANNEKVFIEILDEVTGLPNNTKRYELEEVNDIEFSIRLLVPSFSVIKYRYAKFDGATYQTEQQSSGEPVRYRLYYAQTPGQSRDILYSWGDQPILVATGRLEGQIFDKSTQSPIPDILVSASGKLAFSDVYGKFLIDGLVDGQQNVVFYAPDGHYQTYQQAALISAGQITPAQLELQPRQTVKVSFRVAPPQDAFGAPVYLAGNLVQLGNTFSNLTGSMSINPKLMPQLIPQEDGALSIDLRLYSGTDLRFKFTLGDGFWNAEQDPSGGFRVRQLIVPDHDITLDLSIAAWRTSGFEPITFQVSNPPETSPEDEKFIQFKIQEWTEPIPLWQTGIGTNLYILFSPFTKDDLISYRFCRNADCIDGLNGEMQSSLSQVQPKKEPQTVTVDINNWNGWQANQSNIDFTPSPAPVYYGPYATMVELSPEMNSYWQLYARPTFEHLSAMGTNTVILTPQWKAAANAPLLFPALGQTLFSSQLTNLLVQAQINDLETGLYPQIGFDQADAYWSSGSQNEDWWEKWFESYQDFIMNYAKLADISQSKYLLLGGKGILPTIIGGITHDGNESNLPDDSERYWRDMILEIRKTFKGDLIWVTHVDQNADPLSGFIQTFDGIYIIVDSPLSTSEEPTFDDIAYGFTNIIDQHIYEIYRSTGIPVFIGLGYPSANGAARGCLLVSDQCANDGLYLQNEMNQLEVDLNIQKQIYEAVLPVIASRPWISGTSIRGYDPVLISMDQTSSIAGKPAQAVISDWFTRINSQ